MSTDLTTVAMTAAQAATPKTPVATADVAKAKKAAKDFESVFISQMLGQMFEGLTTDGPFGGGQGEQMFRSFMIDEYAKKLADHGGIGLADTVTRELLKRQELVQ